MTVSQMPETKKKISLVHIIIVNYNGWSDTIECLDSLIKVVYRNINITIVDNNSTDDSLSQISSWIKNKGFQVNLIDTEEPADTRSGEGVIAMIKNKENRGYGAGINTGIKYALLCNPDYILALNNDTVVDPGFLHPLVELCEKDNEIGIASGKIYYHDRPKVIWSNGGKFYPCRGKLAHLNFNETDIGVEAPEKINFINGCMWLIPGHVLRKTGLINEEYFMYVEDLEYCSRVIRSGFTLRICGRSFIYHKVGRSSGSGKFNNFSVFLRTRNLGRFFLKSELNVLCKISAFFIYNLKLGIQLLLRRDFSLIPVQISAIVNSLKKENKSLW